MTTSDSIMEAAYEFLQPIEGILLVNKPSGPTSHDIVDAIRKRFKIEKVGHGGTLDPMAKGLLVIMLGRATKLANRIMAGDKIYEGIMRLGIATDTHDADGKILYQKDCSFVTDQMILNEFKKFTGDILQTPPMISAAKKNGVPLYKLARKGKEVERGQKLVHIYKFVKTSFNMPDVSFTLHCSKGVYVRTLCNDIGENLGCGAHLAALCRLGAGGFSLKDAIFFDDLLKINRDELANLIIPINSVMRTL
jgi:tRNA pseudouridine55 synthase